MIKGKNLNNISRVILLRFIFKRARCAESSSVEHPAEFTRAFIAPGIHYT